MFPAKPISPARLYALKDLHAEVMQLRLNLKSKIRGAIDTIENFEASGLVRRYEIGRTNMPSRRWEERECSQLYRVFNGSAQEVQVVEEALLRHFVPLGRKCGNESMSSIGPITDDTNQVVYCALWF